jgi:hypothetical protein
MLHALDRVATVRIALRKYTRRNLREYSEKAKHDICRPNCIHFWSAAGLVRHDDHVYTHNFSSLSPPQEEYLRLQHKVPQQEWRNLRVDLCRKWLHLCKKISKFQPCNSIQRSLQLSQYVLNKVSLPWKKIFQIVKFVNNVYKFVEVQAFLSTDQQWFWHFWVCCW